MTRLLMFPEPFPDEDFRSVVFRYHQRTSNTTFRQTKQDLFEQKSGKNTLFQTNMAELISRLPIGSKFDLSHLLKSCTWFGIVTGFLNGGEQKKFLKIISEGVEEQTSIHVYIPKGLFSNRIKYCPCCLGYDEENWGGCYIHRVHQLQFLDFCPIHFVKLIECCPVCGCSLSSTYAEKLISSKKCVNCNSIFEGESIYGQDSLAQFKLQMMHEICEIRDTFNEISAEIIHHKIMMKLWNLGYIHYRGKIQKEKFLRDFLIHYTDEQLETVNLFRATLETRYFSARLFTVEHMFNNVIFYLLVIRLLFHTLEDCLAFDEPIANDLPYGSGPWECINRICNEYKKKVIKICDRKSKRSGGVTVTVTFPCPSCGYTYSRLWKSRNPIKGKPGVVSLGHLWMERVVEYYNNGCSIREISRLSGCAQTTIKRFLTTVDKKFSISIKGKGKEVVGQLLSSFNEVTATREVDKREFYRNNLKTTAAEQGIIKRNEIRRLCNVEYEWLKQHDHEWLDTHFPLSYRGKSKMDFSEYDRVLRDRIMSVKIQLIETNHRQIRKMTILNKLTALDRSRLYAFPERLPLSYDAIMKSVETTSEYKLRRISSVIVNIE